MPNPSSVGYARGTQVTTQLTARETFGGPAKAGLGRHIGMGQFTYGAIINGNSGSGINKATTLSGPSYPMVAGKTLRDDNGRVIIEGPDGSFVRQATDLFGKPVADYTGNQLFYPINFNNQIGGVSNPSSRYGPTRAPADGVNANTRMQDSKTVASWNKLHPSRPMRNTPNASRTVPFSNNPNCDCSKVKEYYDSRYVFNNNTLRSAVGLWINSQNEAYKKYGHISKWNVSQVTDMSSLFLDQRTFNDDISNWDVHNVTDMRAMFRGCYNFNQNISHWNTSRVTNMGLMFWDAKKFNQNINTKTIYNITYWDVSKVTDMRCMFRGTVFNQDISNWNTSSVRDMTLMFSFTEKFNQDISNWNTSNVETMRQMFLKAFRFNQDLNGWDTSKVTDMVAMFQQAIAFNQDLNSWDTTNVTSMSAMFALAETFNGIISSWDVSKVTNMRWMFDGAQTFNRDIKDWNTGNVTNMRQMFYFAEAFNQDISSWDVSNVTYFNNFSTDSGLDDNHIPSAFR
jgi:surface protein